MIKQNTAKKYRRIQLFYKELARWHVSATKSRDFISSFFHIASTGTNLTLTRILAADVADFEDDEFKVLVELDKEVVKRFVSMIRP